MTVDPYLPQPARQSASRPASALTRRPAAILAGRIRAGEWARGPLPSVKVLQQDYGVGRDTVLHALRMLRDDGLIFTVSKRGSYVSQPR